MCVINYNCPVLLGTFDSDSFVHTIPKYTKHTNKDKLNWRSVLADVQKSDRKLIVGEFFQVSGSFYVQWHVWMKFLKCLYVQV